MAAQYGLLAHGRWPCVQPRRPTRCVSPGLEREETTERRSAISVPSNGPGRMHGRAPPSRRSASVRAHLRGNSLASELPRARLCRGKAGSPAGAVVSPASCADRPAREVMPSFWNAWRRWVSTVAWVMNKCWAIWRLDRPSAASTATCRSALVSASGPVRAARRGRARAASSSALACPASGTVPVRWARSRARRRGTRAWVRRPVQPEVGAVVGERERQLIPGGSRVPASGPPRPATPRRGPWRPRRTPAGRCRAWRGNRSCGPARVAHW